MGVFSFVSFEAGNLLLLYFYLLSDFSALALRLMYLIFILLLCSDTCFSSTPILQWGPFSVSPLLGDNLLLYLMGSSFLFFLLPCFCYGSSNVHCTVPFGMALLNHQSVSLSLSLSLGVS